MSDKPLKIKTVVDLASRTARVESTKTLGRPLFVNLAGGVALGYQRSRKRNKSGMWHVRWSNGDGTNQRKRLAIADDFVKADGKAVLDYTQAIARARDYAEVGGDRAKLTKSYEPVTVAEALIDYRCDLLNRGGEIWNATQPYNHLKAYREETRINLLSKPVEETTVEDWTAWRNWTVKHRDISGGGMNRISRGMKACLNLAARKDHKRITNIAAWKFGLADLPHEERNNRKPFKLREAEAIIEAAYDHSERFGLWVEANALGCRPSQLAALNVEHFDDDNPADPFVRVMASRKGKKKQRVTVSVSVDRDFARRIRKSIAGRAPDEALFLNPKGGRWDVKRDHHLTAWRQVMVKLGLAKPVAGKAKPGKGFGLYGRGIYSMRHTAITAQVAASPKTGVDLLSIAKTYDTSAKIINDHYAKDILGETRRLMRPAMISVGALGKRAAKVVPMKARG